MAVTENKRSVSLAQPSAHTQPANPSPAKHRSPKPRSPKPQAKRTTLPASLRPVITKRGRTTIRRYEGGRSFHRFEEAKGKAIDYIEFFTSDGYHNIDIAFDDKTAVHFVIEPSFTLDTEYADWKTGNWRLLKRWPLIPSASGIRRK
ncbi:MAG: hypothetical protein LAO78_28960 [Acidobacteriia bacterium]|nr:hypothetical protein [Terriglobia bacterium]